MRRAPVRTESPLAPRPYTYETMPDAIRELIFEVREEPEGGYSARALGESIFAEADDWRSLESEIRVAVDCHYEAAEKPAVVRLHFGSGQIPAP
jgi:hypothetical protein